MIRFRNLRPATVERIADRNKGWSVPDLTEENTIRIDRFFGRGAQPKEGLVFVYEPDIEESKAARDTY